MLFFRYTRRIIDTCSFLRTDVEGSPQRILESSQLAVGDQWFLLLVEGWESSSFHTIVVGQVEVSCCAGYS